MVSARPVASAGEIELQARNEPHSSIHPRRRFPASTSPIWSDRSLSSLASRPRRRSAWGPTGDSQCCAKAPCGAAAQPWLGQWAPMGLASARGLAPDHHHHLENTHIISSVKYNAVLLNSHILTKMGFFVKWRYSSISLTIPKYSYSCKIDYSSLSSSSTKSIILTKNLIFSKCVAE